MRTIFFIFLLCTPALHTAGAQEKAEGQVAEDSLVSMKVDFVHETSIFDICYSVFRALYTFDDRIVPFVFEPLYFELPRPSVQMQGSFVDKIYSYTERGSYYNRSIHFSPGDLLRKSSLRYLRVFRQTMLRDTAYDETAEKARLAREMETYRDTAAYLPTLYAVIDKKHGGDVERYVNHLYRRAILTSRSSMFRFRLNPSKGRMRRDAGFRFVLSRMLYRLWEALGCPEEGVGNYVLRNERLSPQTGGTHTDKDGQPDRGIADGSEENR